jgi:hypothetical protein
MPNPSLVSASGYSTLSQLSQPTKKIARTLLVALFGRTTFDRITLDRTTLGRITFGRVNKSAQALAVTVLRPSVEHLRILKVLALGLRRCRLASKK